MCLCAATLCISMLRRILRLFSVSVVTASAVLTLSTSSQLSAAPNPPAAPSLGTVSNDSVGITWSAPTGSSVVTRYDIYANGSKVGSTALTRYTVDKLASNTEYSISVAACDSSSCSTESLPTNALTKPGVPEALSTDPSDGSVLVSWKTRNLTPPVTYKVWYRLVSSKTWAEWQPGTSKVSPVLVTGLKNWTEYAFKVSVHNATGLTDSQTLSVSPRTTPSAPVISVAGRTGGAVTLSWTKPLSGGNSVTRYELAQGSAIINSSSATSATAASLAPGQSYVFKVRACNVVGCSVYSTPVTVTMPPAPPTALKAIPNNSSMTLTWAASLSSGVTGYSVFYRTSVGAQTTSWIEWTPGVSDSSGVVLVGNTHKNDTSFTIE